MVPTRVEHVLFPSMRLFLKPPKSMATDGTFVQVCSCVSRFWDSTIQTIIYGQTLDAELLSVDGLIAAPNS